MIELTLTPTTLPAKRPYVAPALVIHGDVQTITQKGGTDLDLDSAGSTFNTPPKGQ